MKDNEIKDAVRMHIHTPDDKAVDALEAMLHDAFPDVEVSVTEMEAAYDMWETLVPELFTPVPPCRLLGKHLRVKRGPRKGQVRRYYGYAIEEKKLMVLPEWYRRWLTR